MGKSLTIMAIIFYLFYYVNNLTYYSMMTTVQFLGILQRISIIMGLDEHKTTRQNKIEHNYVCVKLEKADYTWGMNK